MGLLIALKKLAQSFTEKAFNAWHCLGVNRREKRLYISGIEYIHRYLPASVWSVVSAGSLFHSALQTVQFLQLAERQQAISVASSRKK